MGLEGDGRHPTGTDCNCGRRKGPSNPPRERGAVDQIPTGGPQTQWKGKWGERSRELVCAGGPQTPGEWEGKRGAGSPTRASGPPTLPGGGERSLESYSRRRASDPPWRGKQSEDGIIPTMRRLLTPREGGGKGGRGPQPPPRSPTTPPTPTPTHTGKGGTLPPPRRSPHRWSTTTVGVEGFAPGLGGLLRYAASGDGALRGSTGPEGAAAYAPQEQAAILREEEKHIKYPPGR